MLTLKTGVILSSLLASHSVLLFAGFFAPYSPAAQFRADSFAPPASIHFVDRTGHFHFRPFLDLSRSRGSIAPIYFLLPGSTYKLLGFIPASVHLFGVKAPAHVFLFGADVYGRDQFSRFLYGGRISLLVGLLATSLSLFLGTAGGLLAGFYGGWPDNLVMRGSELFLALPWIYMLLGIRALLPLALEPDRVLLLLVAVIGVLGWARPARLVRAIILSARSLPYVSVAAQFGASDWYLLRRHLLPEAYGVLLAQAALLIPQYIAAEVTLSFLGLGMSEPAPSWGSMLSAMREISVVMSYWWVSIPALALIPFFFCYQVLAQSIHQKALKEA